MHFIVIQADFIVAVRQPKPFTLIAQCLLDVSHNGLMDFRSMRGQACLNKEQPRGCSKHSIVALTSECLEPVVQEIEVVSGCCPVSWTRVMQIC